MKCIVFTEICPHQKVIPLSMLSDYSISYSFTSVPNQQDIIHHHLIEESFLFRSVHSHGIQRQMHKRQAISWRVKCQLFLQIQSLKKEMARIMKQLCIREKLFSEKCTFQLSKDIDLHLEIESNRSKHRVTFPRTHISRRAPVPDSFPIG